MTKHLLLGLLGATTLIGTGHAGLKGNYPINIDLANRLATGGLATTRASTYANAVIACTSSVSVASNGASYFGTCSARDNAGLYAACITYDAELVTQMARVQGDSRVTFDWDAAGTCTRIQVQQSSAQAPKAP
jgi:hypothetical protein